MYHQHYLPTIGRSAVAATRRRWSRCMLVAVAACMLGLLPGTRPHAQPVAVVPVEDHWMADQKDIIGQRPLRQVVIPGSHDAATYDDPSCPYTWDVLAGGASRGGLHPGPEPRHHRSAQRRQPLLRPAVQLHRQGLLRQGLLQFPWH